VRGDTRSSWGRGEGEEQEMNRMRLMMYRIGKREQKENGTRKRGNNYGPEYQPHRRFVIKQNIKKTTKT
jgi:hypothetical protein